MNDLIHHLSAIVAVKGDPSDKPQALTVRQESGKLVVDRSELAPGRIVVTVDNRTASRASMLILGVPPGFEKNHLVFEPFLSGKRLISLQTFRELFSSEVVQGTEGIGVRDITILFTDLKGSTALYERIGDLKAFSLVHQHFDKLGRVIGENSGAFVKTIGDAVMASFLTPLDAMKAALEMNREIIRFNRAFTSRDVILKVGIHRGPCIAVTLNDRLDYFGQTVNTAARVQRLAGAEEVYVTEEVLSFPGVKTLLKGSRVFGGKVRLKGIQDEVQVYKIVPPDFGNGRDRPGPEEQAAETGLMASAEAAAAASNGASSGSNGSGSGGGSGGGRSTAVVVSLLRPRSGILGEVQVLSCPMKVRLLRTLCITGLAVLLCLAAAPLRADGEQPSITLSTGARFGAFYGLAHEFVYNQALSPNYENSELVWALEPMFFSGAALSLDTSGGLFVTLDVRQGFAGKAGLMTDSDFLNGDGVRTHFSQSDSDAERANIVDLKAGWDFYRRHALKIGFFGDVSYMDFKWSARDGYLQYPTTGSPYTMSPFVHGSYTPWSPDETKTPIYGTGILYESTWLGFALGVRSRYQFQDGISVDASFAFTPLLRCSTEDNHVFRQLDFFSTLSGGFMIEPRVAVEYVPFKGGVLRLEIGYRYSWGMKGDLTEVSTGVTNVSNGFPYYAGPDSTGTGTGDSGASLSILDASLGLSISL